MTSSVSLALLVVCWSLSVLFAQQGGMPDLPNVVNVNVEVRDFKMCREYPDVPFKYVNVSLEMDPEDNMLYVRGVLILKETMQQGLKGALQISKCVREDSNTCEKYLLLQIDDFCQQLPKEEKPWTSFRENLENFDPHCPVAPGIYRQKTTPIKTSNISNLGLPVGLWQVTSKFFFEEKLMCCIEGYLVISRKRGI